MYALVSWDLESFENELVDAANVDVKVELEDELDSDGVVLAASERAKLAEDVDAEGKMGFRFESQSCGPWRPGPWDGRHCKDGEEAKRKGCEISGEVATCEVCRSAWACACDAHVSGGNVGHVAADSLPPKNKRKRKRGTQRSARLTKQLWRRLLQ